MADDNKSVCSATSTLSSSQVKTECPHCNKDYQTRALFNHIYTKHFRQFSQSISQKWLKEAEEDEPLRVWWDVKDDFDEVKEVDIYACLSSKKTFMTHERAVQHFKKNKEDLKAHNKALKQLKKDIKDDSKKALKERKSNPVKLAYQDAKTRGDFILINSAWSSVMYYRTTIDYILNLYKKLEDDFSMYWVSGASDGLMTLKEFREKYSVVSEEITTLLLNKSTNLERLIELEAFLFNFFWIQIRQNFSSALDIYEEETGKKPVAFEYLHVCIFEHRQLNTTNSLDDFIDSLPEAF